jgi:hypothetical protein
VSSSFRKYRQSLVPTTHQRAQGAAWQGQLGDVDDTLVDRAKQAVKARMPLLAPTDALNLLGIERSIPRGPSESDAAYGLRLQAAWNTWPWAGTAFGILSALAALGYTNVYLATCGGQLYTLPSPGTTLTIAALANGQWWIDSSRPFPDVTKAVWSANAAYGAARRIAIPTADGGSWAPSTSYASGKVVQPTVGNLTGLLYRSSGGTSGTTQPTWPTAPGGTVGDNGITWIALRADLWFSTPTGGTTGATQPVWPTAVGATVQDNTVIWVCDGQNFWSRFDVVFPTPLPASWGGGSTVPAYASDEVTRIRKVINTWKPAAATCNRIVVVTTGGASVGGVTTDGGVIGLLDGTFGDGTRPFGTSATTVWSPV